MARKQRGPEEAAEPSAVEPSAAHPTGAQDSGRLAELMAARRDKLAALRAQGQAFPNDFRPDSSAAELRAAHDHSDDAQLAQAAACRLAGRIMLRRVMGKASFMTLQDSSGDIQAYLSADHLGEQAYAAFKNSDIGDLVGIAGTLMRTRRGELTVQATEFRLLVKALRPLPDKHHGLTDREAIARHRYLDLLLGGQRIVRARAEMNRLMRQYLDERGYLEVETPMMHPIPGGANARPFTTHLNSLDRDLYLRVAPELYLKMLLVGGIERLYELNRNFRNEGVSTRHNPEFTMLEFYLCWADWHASMAETEGLIHHLTTNLTGGERLTLGETEYDMRLPFKRQSMVRAVAEKLGVEPREVTDHERLKQLSAQYAANEGKGERTGDEKNAGEAQDGERDWHDWNDWGQSLLDLFEKAVEPHLQQPVFITHFPLSVSPLSRLCTDADADDGGDHPLVERWELLIGGREIAGGFSELNDYEDQAERFRQQVARKDEGDSEAMHYDHKFIEALEYGMPPATGVGIGIDRLLMLLTGENSIREVILFPQLRDIRDHS